MSEKYYIVRKNDYMEKPQVIDGPYYSEVIAEFNKPEDEDGFRYMVNQISTLNMRYYRWGL